MTDEEGATARPPKVSTARISKLMPRAAITVNAIVFPLFGPIVYSHQTNRLQTLRIAATRRGISLTR